MPKIHWKFSKLNNDDLSLFVNNENLQVNGFFKACKHKVFL